MKFFRNIELGGKQIDLFIATTKELTGKNTATTREVFDAILRIGKLCLTEAGSELRKQHPNLPNPYSIKVAVECTRDTDGDMVDLRVNFYDDGRWVLYGLKPPCTWEGADLWVYTD
jgi:hypothetical protein